MSSIRYKLGIIFILFVVLVAGGVIITYDTIKFQKADGLLINLSGRQRMLIQKMTKEAFGLIKAYEEKVSAESYQKASDNTVKLFDRTLFALKDGGNTVDGAGKEVVLPPAPVGEIYSQLEKIVSLWKEFKVRMDIITIRDEEDIVMGSPVLLDAIDFVEENNMFLLEEMNRVVGMFELEADKKVRRLKVVQVTFLAIAITICIFGWVVISRLIIRPLDNIITVTKGISTGRKNLSDRVNISSNDELGDLARIFNEMTYKLKEHRDHLEELVRERTRELEGAREQVIRSEKLAAVGQLASSISHELRNPLGNIANSAYYLNMKLKDADEKVMKHIDILQREVLRSNMIITDLLDFSRTSAPTVEDVDLKSVIKEALAVTELTENVVLKNRLDESIPLVLADPDQIRQVFQNLITNALQAMPEGGSIEIEVVAREDFVETKIRDTGEGISEENLGKIFEPLFTTKAKGIGLGLAIVKGIVERHKGSIEVTSEVGKGTTFTVRLPFRGGKGGE